MCKSKGGGDWEFIFYLKTKTLYVALPCQSKLWQVASCKWLDWSTSDAVITIRSKCRFIWNYDKILICVSCKRPREERTAWTLNLLVFWKVAVQCRTGALHCHCLLGNCVFIVVVLLHFQSTNAEWLTTLSSSNLNILFSFLLTSPYSRMIIEPDDRSGLLLCVSQLTTNPVASISPEPACCCLSSFAFWFVSAPWEFSFTDVFWPVLQSSSHDSEYVGGGRGEGSAMKQKKWWDDREIN